MTSKFDPATAIQRIDASDANRGVNPAITDSATFTFPEAHLMTETFHGETEGYFLYSRHWNPSNMALCKALAAMEGTEAAWVTGSGLAAITCALLHEVQSGDHIISSMTTYGGTFAFMANYMKKFGVETTFVNFQDLDAVRKAVSEHPNTKVLYTETMNNPLLRIANVPELSKIAHSIGAKLIVDNTFTPMIFSPYRLGADVVVYSMTKFINGKNDCVAGAICGSGDYINSLIDVNNGTCMLLGPVLDPMRSSSILKNLHTLHIRMQKHSENAMYLAKRFKEVGFKYNYPGLPEHPDHALFNSMMNAGYGYGGMISIDMGTAEAANKIMEIMQRKGVGYLAVSLGYFKTLFSNSGKSTSSEVPDDIQREMGMSEGLIRFSMGLDNDIEATFQLIKESVEESKR
ncbi:MAG: aminotransferase class I/II-fold pyridoxal phosphate-dependent enzyme [Bacteroidales bacterium]|nr:aminotransferase class I/II-fold pyridoxal phosphate-dependent enzyme [Bacteroidales bacterium]